TPPPGRTVQPTARTTSGPTSIAAAGGTPFTGATVETQCAAVQVEIAVSGGKLLDVEALQLPSDRSRSARISQYSAPILRSEPIPAQSAPVAILSGARYTRRGYTRSGATYTSRAYALSLDSALKRSQGQ